MYQEESIAEWKGPPFQLRSDEGDVISALRQFSFLS
jgi:hypothetical protein